MNKHLAPVALSLGLLGVVGGVAATQAFQPAEKPAKVQFVQPAAETVTPEPTPEPTVTVTATVTPAPVAKPKPAPAPVESSQAPAPAPAPVQRQAVVSEPAPEPAPEATGSEAAARGNIVKPPPGTLAPNSNNGTPEPK